MALWNFLGAWNFWNVSRAYCARENVMIVVTNSSAWLQYVPNFFMEDNAFISLFSRAALWEEQNADTAADINCGSIINNLATHLGKVHMALCMEANAYSGKHAIFFHMHDCMDSSALVPFSVHSEDNASWIPILPSPLLPDSSKGIRCNWPFFIHTLLSLFSGPIHIGKWSAVSISKNCPSLSWVHIPMDGPSFLDISYRICTMNHSSSMLSPNCVLPRRYAPPWSSYERREQYLM